MLGRRLDCQITSAVALALLAGVPAGAAPVVDTKSTTTVTNLTREQLERMPVGRNLEELARTCPGNSFPTLTSRTQTLTGGPPEPQYIIDGVPMVDINCMPLDDIEMIEVYKAHNAVRAEYGAPPLIRDPALEATAGAHAGLMMKAGKLVHRPREGRGTVRENLSLGLPWWTPREHINSWLKEKKNFKAGVFPNVSLTGYWFDVGHLTQMIWIETFRVGCGMAVGGAVSAFVCHYGPGGNKDGKSVGIPVTPRQYAIEQPKLPTSEVFKQGATSQGTATDIGASAYANDKWLLNEHWSFNLGVRYDENPQPTTDLSAASPLIADILTRNDGATTVDNIIALDHEYGYDGALFVGYDLGSFRLESEVAYKKADLESFGTSIRLPGETSSPPASPGDEMMGRRASLFDLGIYGGGAYHTDWFDLPGSDSHGLDLGISPWDFDQPRQFGVDQVIAQSLGVPLTQNGSLNLAYIWMTSDTVTTIGGVGGSYSGPPVGSPNSINSGGQGFEGFEWSDLVRSVRVDQAWGAAQLSAALYQLRAANSVPLHFDLPNASFGHSAFDIGIYAGGAWSSDWFEFRSDGSLDRYPPPDTHMGFFGPYRPVIGAGEYDIPIDLPFQITYDFTVDTKVEQPGLPAKEVYKVDPPEKLEDPM